MNLPKLGLLVNRQDAHNESNLKEPVWPFALHLGNLGGAEAAAGKFSTIAFDGEAAGDAVWYILDHTSYTVLT